MLNYMDFKEKVSDELMKYMPEEFKNFDLKIIPKTKVNESLDAIVFQARGNEDSIMPMIYVNDLFRSYQNGLAFETCLEQAAEILAGCIRNRPDFPGLDFSKARDNIIFQLINREQNKEMLKGMPHRDVENLSVIYRWVVGRDEDGISSTMINNELSDTLGLSEEQLYSLAEKNTEKLFPSKVIPLSHLISDMIPGGEEIAAEAEADKDMWVITNDIQINGAAAILNPDNLQKVADVCGSNLYILPSSIHECLAVPVEMADVKMLEEMVKEVNSNMVESNERLSDNVYFYDKEERKLSICAEEKINVRKTSLDERIRLASEKQETGMKEKQPSKELLM